MEIGHFKIPGHATKRHWAVYILVATPKKNNDKTLLYVGKVGDNRSGCNPVISRIGNHFSFNQVHSQIRNAIKNTEKYDYEYFYCLFEEYDETENSWKSSREKTNELERELNRIVQREMNSRTHDLINPFKGKYISAKENTRRANLLNNQERDKLLELWHKAK